jgi:hypothetical protein
VLVLAQALDNKGPDRCVVDGRVMDATEAGARDCIAQMSMVRRNGRPFSTSKASITASEHSVVITAASEDRDADGRAAPLAILATTAELTPIHDLLAKVTQYASLLDRHIDSVSLQDVVRRWDDAGKAKRGRRRRLRNLVQRLFSRLQYRGRHGR